MPSANVTTALLDELALDMRTAADYRILPAFLETILHTAFTILMICYCVIYRRDRARRARGFLTTSASLYILCACVWFIDVYIVWLELYRLIPGRIFDESILDSDAREKLLGIIYYIRYILRQTIFLLCDLIPLWRAYVLCGKQRWVQVSGLSIVAASFVLYMIDVVCIYGINLVNPPEFVLRFVEMDDGIVANALLTSAAALTAFAQVFSTAVISWKAWNHRREVKKLFPAHSSSSSHQRVFSALYVVIESGVVYSILWVVYFMFNNGSLGVVGSYWSDLWMIPIAGIYPTLLVVVISLRASMLGKTVNDASVFTGEPIRFATNVDQEALGVHMARLKESDTYVDSVSETSTS